MASKKITTLEPQTSYRVIVLKRYRSQARNKFSTSRNFNLPMLSYFDANGKEYYYQDFELWGPYLHGHVARRESKVAAGYEAIIYPEDFDVIIEESLPVWKPSEFLTE